MDFLAPGHIFFDSVIFERAGAWLILLTLNAGIFPAF
jgi:hypothetical protein